MKKSKIILLISLISLTAAAFTFHSGKPSYGLTKGTPAITSITSLAFGPDGILFIGDSKSAVVYAIDTKDQIKSTTTAPVDIKNIDQKIASLLGTPVQNITIRDIAVNPLSKKIYCSIQHIDGTPVLLSIEGDKILNVSLKDVEYSSIALNNPPPDEKNQRGQSKRISSISDLNFSDGKLLVSGLSNQEFSSTLRSIPFPFTNKQDASTLEIYHAAHGKYETTSPINTFTIGQVNGKKYLIASYTCTPLVLFPLDDLKPGMHVKGRTVAEMGAGNQPLDMITVTKGGNTFLVMSNSNRPVFRVNFKNIETFEGSLTKPVVETFATEGVSFVSMPLTNVLQLDKLDDGKMVMLQRRADGSLDLWSSDKQEWLLK